MSGHAIDETGNIYGVEDGRNELHYSADVDGSDWEGSGDATEIIVWCIRCNDVKDPDCHVCRNKERRAKYMREWHRANPQRKTEQQAADTHRCIACNSILQYDVLLDDFVLIMVKDEDCYLCGRGEHQVRTPSGPDQVRLVRRQIGS